MPEDAHQQRDSADSSTEPNTESSTDSLQYLLSLSRPRFWLYLAGPVLVGAAYGASSLQQSAAGPTLALFAYFLVPANVYLYAVNDFFDREIDRENPKKVGSDARESRFEGQTVVQWAIAAAIVLLFPLLSVVPMVAWGWIALWLFLATNYSAPPLRFKTTPRLDSVSNGLYILPGVAAYTALAGHHPPVLAVLGGWLWTMGMHTFSAIPDVVPDRRAGIQTTATWLGARRAYWYCAGVWLAAVLAFGSIDWRLGVPLLAYPVLALGVRRANVDVDRAYWWFPYLNALVGMTLTLGGLWRLVDG